jgi:hypothetical protein
VFMIVGLRRFRGPGRMLLVNGIGMLISIICRRTYLKHGMQKFGLDERRKSTDRKDS